VLVVSLTLLMMSDLTQMWVNVCRQQLGLHASPEVSLLFYVSPTGSYFKGKTMGGLKLHLERKRSRAAKGGTGNVKCCGNYAVTMKPLL
jgi:branched-chain amino acid aminotransferase